MRESKIDRKESNSKNPPGEDVNNQLTEEDKKRMQFIDTSYTVIMEYVKEPLLWAIDERPRDESHYINLEERFRFLSLLFDKLADDCDILCSKGKITTG